MRDRPKQTWSELGRTQRWVVVVLGTVQVGLEAMALLERVSSS